MWLASMKKMNNCCLKQKEYFANLLEIIKLLSFRWHEVNGKPFSSFVSFLFNLCTSLDRFYGI